MNGGSLSEFEYVLTMLASSMEPLEKRGQPRDHNDGIVLLLGAGCSRQYGLPNFNELLTYIWDDCFPRPADSLGGFQALRDELEKYWQAQGPESRCRILKRHLEQVKTVCPGYHRLAEMCRQRYVKAIVNMNFDNLLEKALAEVLKEGELGFKISTSFRAASRDHLIVYKPHGTIETTETESALGELIGTTENLLSIAKDQSDFAENLHRRLERCLQKMERDRFWVADEILLAARDLVASVGALADQINLNGAEAEAVLPQVERAKTRLEQMRLHPLWAKNDLILDIANSDLFADPDEQRRAHGLLTRHDVVSIGYSGVDAKIAAALRAFEGRDPRDRKLYFVNLTRPDPRMLLVMAERASQDLCIAGSDAAFENFMEHLEIALNERRRDVRSDGSDRGRAATRFPHLMTRSEQKAMDECLRLARSIRAAINVSDRSSSDIKGHGDNLYEICAELAAVSGICLTSPEKFLLHGAAYLHDLGYFSAYSGGSFLTGLELLKRHGEITARLIEQRFQDDAEIPERIIPSSYQGTGRGSFRTMLVEMCRYHASFRFPPGEDLPEVEIDVLGVPVPVRFKLLHALFSAAEHIVKEHPFLPSSDPVVAQEESDWAIEDPVLDLYLRRRDQEVAYIPRRKKIEAKITTRFQGKRPSRKAIWLLSMAATFIQRLVRENPGWGVELVCREDISQPVAEEVEDFQIFKELLQEALSEELDSGLERVQRVSQAEVADILIRARKGLDKILQQVQQLLKGLPKGGNPLESKGGNPLEDLTVILPLIGVWLESIPRQLREDWITEMRLDLGLAQRVLHQLQERHGSVADGDLAAAIEGLKRSSKYYDDNVPGASLHAAVSTLGAAQKILDWAARHLQLSDEIRSGLTSKIWYPLGRFRKAAEECSTGEAISTLDLLAIYTLPQEGCEPRVPLTSEPVTRAIQRLDRMRRTGPQEPLHLYIRCKRESLERRQKGGSPDDAMTQAFLRSFEEIIYPAWRFFARHWHDRSETLLMARACLDLGSSRFRPEVAGGLRNLLDRAKWDTREIHGRTVPVAYAHDECTICTSRLLYVFSHAKRLFPQEDLKRFVGSEKRKSLDDTVAGLLNYLLWRPQADDSWWGLGTESASRRGVHSADYLAWAARAVAFCKSVDREIEERTGDSWLKSSCQIDTQKLMDLLRQRWDALFAAKSHELLSPRAEEPQSFTLGRVALAYLDLQRLDDSVRDFIVKSKPIDSFYTEMSHAFDEVWRESLAQMSKFYLLPVRLLLDATKSEDEKRANAALLADLCLTCIDSRIWIREGSDAGSWGFNVKNTQAIVTSLVAFWRFAFEPGNVDRFREAFAISAPR